MYKNNFIFRLFAKLLFNSGKCTVAITPVYQYLTVSADTPVTPFTPT